MSWEEFLDAADSEGLYVNLHTTAYPGGAIRGQVVPGEQAVAWVLGLQMRALSQLLPCRVHARISSMPSAGPAEPRQLTHGNVPISTAAELDLMFEATLNGENQVRRRTALRCACCPAATTAACCSAARPGDATHALACACLASHALPRPIDRATLCHRVLPSPPPPGPQVPPVTTAATAMFMMMEDDMGMFAWELTIKGG